MTYIECDTSCGRCIGPGATNCTECSGSNKFCPLSNGDTVGKCVAACTGCIYTLPAPRTTYLDTGICKSMHLYIYIYI